MPNRHRIKVGDHLVTDEKTGTVIYASEAARDWDGVVTHKSRLDGDHPQYHVRSLNDPYPVQPVRPELGTDFDLVCGFYRPEWFPNSSIRRKTTIADDILPLGGIGQLPITNGKADECGLMFYIQEAEDTLSVFPSVVATSTNDANDNILVATHTINLPDGLNPGHRVLIFFTSEGNNDLTIPGAWTELLETANSTVTLHVFYRDLDGTEGFTGLNDSITVTTDNITSSTYIANRIEGFNAAAAPEVSTSDTGSSTSPDPDELVLSTVDDWLIFAVEAHNTASTEATIPANYGNDVTSRS